MKLRLWGTRGSIPAPGPSTVRYGGNTSCVEVRLDDGTLIIIDAGSGIRGLGATLGACQATLLLSHYHWDHIQGFPFFASAFNPDSSIRVIGPESEGKGPKEYLFGEMTAPYFPAPPGQLQGLTGCAVVPATSFTIGGARIRTARTCHPGMTLGYRIEADGWTAVYLSDDEVDVAPPEILAGVVDLARDADLLIHDCQYAEVEYPARRGWGHSTPRQAVKVAAAAGVRHLMLFHHDPAHSDEQLEALAEEAQRCAGSIGVLIGREGAVIDGRAAGSAAIETMERRAVRSAVDR
jgi:phosphoribosyl 1,2-cyclic phosphodiesterase